LIQVNASSLIGKDGHFAKKFIAKLIKKNLIDFVSSDIHETRVNYMGEAYAYASKKFGKKITNDIFEANALKIINLLKDKKKKED